MVENFVETVEATLPREATIVKTIGDEVMVVSPDAALADRVGGRLPRSLLPPAAAAGRDPQRRRRLPRRRLLRQPGQPRPPDRQPGAGRRGAGHRPGRRGDRRPRAARLEPIGEVSLKGFPVPTALFVVRPPLSGAAARLEPVDADLLDRVARRRADRAAAPGGRAALRRPRLGLHARPRGARPRRRAVRALHVDYGLREDSDDDERYCAALCGRLGVELDGRAAGASGGPRQPPGLGARLPLRRRGPAGASARDATIVTGHTADDQVETILYRLASSPSRRALLGMKPRDGRLARPLLGTSRERGHRLLRASAGCTGARTATNEEPTYARNRVRHGLLPELEAIHPAAAANVLRTAALLRDEAEVLDALVAAELDGSGAARPRHDRPRPLRASCRRRCAASSCSGSPTPPPAGRSPGAARFAEQVAGLTPRRLAMLDLGDGVRAVARARRPARRARR